MENLHTPGIISTDNLFEDNFMDPKVLYLHSFNRLPSLSYIGNVDGEKAFATFKEQFGGKIASVYRYDWYESRKKQYRFDTTLVVLDNYCLIEFYKSYCEIWHDGQQQEFINAVTVILTPLKVKQRREPLEVNLVIRGRNKLELKAKEIKRTKLDLGLFYGDAFKETDELIRKRLNKKNDKGIVLLHGLPGAGKTTYLRYLIGKIKKRVLFVSPAVAENLMNPDFIELLTSNPNTVLIIEDAENIVMDRKLSQGSAVSNLLNISDGLLADFLNVQLICTFNNSLTLIDSALLRKGRLIAKYEFGKLTIAQAQRLSDHLGFDSVITKPMTVAEIAGQHEKEYKESRTEIIGFRTQNIPSGAMR